jgi:hypothetical protein
MTPRPPETDRRSVPRHRGVFDEMNPELTHLIVLDKMTRFQQDARRYRLARVASARPPRLVRTAIQLRLRACRDELERLAHLKPPDNRESEMS